MRNRTNRILGQLVAFSITFAISSYLLLYCYSVDDAAISVVDEASLVDTISDTGMSVPQDRTEEPNSENVAFPDIGMSSPEESETESKASNEGESKKEYAKSSRYSGPWLPAKQSSLTETELTYGDAFADIAEREFESYGWTPCGSRYWAGHELCPWSVDFVYWCANQLGYVGYGKLFGAQAHRAPELVWNLVRSGATVYYPGDGTVPRAGDIAIWWCGGHPGAEADANFIEEAMYAGVVLGGTSENLSVISGYAYSWAPTKAILAKSTVQADEALFGNVYLMMILRPKYPKLFLESDKNGIHQALCRLLYGGVGGYVTCGFDGYEVTNGRHEGIDFYCGAGSSVYAVSEGTVTRVSYGGDNALSTVCVYDDSCDRTVVYLHTAPSHSLYVGQHVRFGDVIGTEAARGASATHTHVEVVTGKAYYANYSVDDYLLDNEDPYRYWANELSVAVIRNRSY